MSLPSRFRGACAVAVVVLGPAAGVACKPARAASPVPVQVHARHDGFWWLSTGEQSAAVACFGPTIETRLGLHRPWSLVVHLPGGDEPLSCTQGLVALAEAYPILSEGTSFRVELRPRNGLTWGEVHGEDGLVAEVRGLF